MRTISSDALAKLATKLGTEPIIIIEIQWVVGGSRVAYAGRDLAGVKGRILEIGGLDNVVQISGGSQSQQINIVLDDTDGSIKSIIDRNDIHKRPCWVYQWFDGLDLSDKFLLCAGQINTPITWKEGDRTITFDVISKIEDAEVGFSIEEGDFQSPDPNLIGKAWPLCFGTVINAPALMLTTARQGTLATGVGISDYTLQARLEAARKLLCPSEFKGYDVEYSSGSGPTAAAAAAFFGEGFTIVPLWGDQAGCAESRCQTVATLEGEIAAQASYEFTTITIFGGENFPQGVPLKLNINGAIFAGTFSGETFTITARIHPDLANPLTPGGGLDTVIDVTSCHQEASIYQVPNTSANNPGPSSDAIQASQDAYNALPTSQFFWANAGATVALQSDQLVSYVANILPSTILRVAAYRDTDAGRVLVMVPPEAYTILQVDYVGYQVMLLVFGRPLSSLGVGWTDDLFVTLTSSVGPNTVDVLKWLIQTYTSYGIDDTSFDHVRALIDNYPSHFMMPGRLNVIDALDQIAYQARCAIWLADGVFYIKYLPEEPTTVDTIVEDDVLASTLELSHTATEDLITKYIATWKADYAQTEDSIVIYRHNVKKYGTVEKSFNYFIYNILDLVRKSATFWLIRKANTWRRASFQTPLNKLNLEVFDAVSMTLPDVSGSTVKALVEKASYDSASNAISFECWTPIRSGETSPYDFAWPADVSETLIFPTLEERAQGFAGGANGPNFVVKAPVGSALNTTTTLVQGFQLECNGQAVRSVTEQNIECHSDFGLRKPSDRGDTKPSPKAASENSGVQGGYNPLPSTSNSGATCCADATKLANQALSEARAAAAAAGSGAGGGGSGEPAGDDPSRARKQQLPKKADKQKDGKCLYRVRVDYITTLQVHRPRGYTDDQGHTGIPRSSRAGDTGFINGSSPAGSEFSGFNTMAAATSYASAVQKEIDGKNNSSEGGWTVGNREALLVFPPIGPEPTPDGKPCVPDSNADGSTVKPKMVSFDES